VIDRQAPTAAGLARVPVTIDESPEHVTIHGVQTDGGASADYRTDIVIRLPRSATVDRLSIQEGRLSIQQFSGVIRADLQRGPIDAVDLAGTARLETNIGPIVVSRAELTPGGLLRLRTFNGDVRLGLRARPSDARILALALNGPIRSEIPLTMKQSWGPRWGEATLGRGEPLISLDVVTGTIEITCPTP
jgi:hypothetical protein